ncbi:MAG: hypothetical protein HY819_21730 [Acidobacteria bacterium]|nr:hypothetical protein [Acidobacteriota bacterium]
MITKEHIAKKLQERLERKCTAIGLTHWAKAIMFDYFEGKRIYDPAEKDLLERAIMRIANSSTNYRTFLFDAEIVKILTHLGYKAKSNSPNGEVYSISIILGQQNNPKSKEAIKIISEQLPKEKNLSIRQQGSGVVLTANEMSEKEIHTLASLLQPHSYIMSLNDTR